jgi:hypothetical protein
LIETLKQKNYSQELKTTVDHVAYISEVTDQDARQNQKTRLSSTIIKLQSRKEEKWKTDYR